MKTDKPPTYTYRESDNGDKSDEELPPDFYSIVHQELPTYFESTMTPGWKIVINNRFWVDGFRIFVSLDASNKFEVFKNSKNAEVIDLQEQGYGVPIFKVITHSIPFSTKFLTFRRYVPTNLHPFDIDKDYYDYCKVKKVLHLGYDTYIFDFNPEPKAPELNFQLFLFSHSQLPIHDYIYKGNKHRWVDESRLKGFRKLWTLKYGFKHTMLKSDQLALTDNWDGKSDKLIKDKKNPYLEGYLKNLFSVSSKYPKSEYYGAQQSDTLGESEAYFKSGYAELKLDDIENSTTVVNYETIFSLKQDSLVSICVAAVLKRQKDIVEENERAATGTG